MTKDEARKELLETLEEYCHDKGYNLQVFAGMSDWVYTLYPLQKTMTNGDWLRAQDDETMADFIAEGEAYARVLSVTDGDDGTIIVKDKITSKNFLLIMFVNVLIIIIFLI